MNKYKLEEEDIKEIKYEMRFGFIFFYIMLGLGLGVNLLVYFYQDTPDINLNYIISIIFIFLAVFVLWKVNSKLNKDLKYGMKYFEEDKIWKKLKEDSYEAGSGYISKAVTVEMKPTIKFGIIVGNIKYDIEEELFNNCQENDIVRIYYAEFSKTRLGFEIVK